jgi:hypothetical protein
MATAVDAGRRPVARPRVVAVAGAVFATAAAVALALPDPAKGWAVLVVALGGCAALVPVARAAGRAGWLRALGVVIPISALQVLPDWYLAAGPGSLRFPDVGGIRIGDAVPLAMAGMWALPLLVVVVLARGSLWRGALWSLVVFGAAELAAPALELWEPAGGVTTVLGVAPYVLPAEAALGAATVLAVRWAGDRPLGERVVAAAAVSVFYTGALALSLFLLERAELTLSA